MNTVRSFFSFLRCKPASINFTESKNGLSVRIDTARLVLKSITPQDVGAYTKLYGDKEVIRLFASGELLAANKVATRVNMWIERWKKNDPYSALAVFSKEGTFIGHAVLGHGDKPGQSEAAILLHKEAWNKGYGKEVGSALKDYASATVQKGYLLDGKPLEEITATAKIENAPMIKIIEKLGMQRIRTVEKFGSSRHYYSIKLYTNETNGSNVKASFSSHSNASPLANDTAARKVDQGRTSTYDVGLSRIYSIFVDTTNYIGDCLDASTNRIFGVFQ